MDVEMDIDLGIDADDSIEAEPFETSQYAVEPPASNLLPPLNTMDESNEMTTDAGKVAAPEKIHIRGLDELATEDILAYAAFHFPSHEPARIEWINDSSANIVYPTSETADAALNSFSEPHANQSQCRPMEERRAKSLSTHPNIALAVRQAHSKDVKAPRAHESSRFYLLHPDKDPREQHRRGTYDHNVRAYRSTKRRRDEDEDGSFDADMYDDDPESLARRAQRRSNSKRAKVDPDRRRDLFANRLGQSVSPRLRNRSASPLNYPGEESHGFEVDERVSSMPPPSPRNRGKELFPTNHSPSRSALRPLSSSNGRELFPATSTSIKKANEGKELFTTNGASPVHRRTDAFDAKDETIDLFAAKLASRRTELGANVDNDVHTTVSAEGEHNTGMSIKGAARSVVNARIKELFPKRFDNAGKELFDRVERRPTRRKAEDLFS